MREIDVVAPPLIPFLYPERVLHACQRRGVGRYAAGAKQSSIPEERWPEIIARAEHEGLRKIARDFGVSHEAVRAVFRAAGRADLVADAGRAHRLAAAAPPPPPARAKVPKERHKEVALLCQRHTQADVAAMFGVSQATIWRIVRRAQGQPACRAASPAPA